MGNFLTVAVFDLGVLGLGVSTPVSTFLCSVLNLARFQYYFKKMGVHREPYRFRFEHVTSLFSYSLPNMFQQSAMFLISFLTAPIYNGLGYTAVAVLSITSRIQSLLTTLYYAMARTLGNFAAQCIGAKKYYKIRPAIGVAMLQSCFFFVPLLILMWLFPNHVCSIFVDQATEMSVTEYLLIYIRRFLPLVFLNMVCAVFHSTFRGIKANHHLIISTATSGVVNLVVCYLITPIYGIVGVFIGSTSSWLIECIYIAVIYFTGFWVPKSIRQQVLASPGDSSIEEEPI
jgi:Na+-driven multidrug efflux pump